MPNSNEHKKIAAIGGGLVFGVVNTCKQLKKKQNNPDYKFDFLQLLQNVAIGTLGGFCIATLPDILEPATRPNHRAFFHSKTMLLLLILGSKLINDSDINPELKNICQSLNLGYGLHLLSDSLTPKGLPLI